MVVPAISHLPPPSFQPPPAMNMSKSHRERLTAQVQTAHRDRANALIERRVRIAELEALQLRIEELDEYVESLTRALDGPTYTAMPRPVAARR